MELSTYTSPEQEVLDTINQNPKIIPQLDMATIDALIRNQQTKWGFFKLIAQPLLAKIPLPRKDIRLALEVDGENIPNELHLHIEFKDFSTLLIIELEGMTKFTAIDLLDEQNKKSFFGALAGNIQKATQSDKISIPEKGQKNSKLTSKEKKDILFQIAENLLKAA